VDNQPSQPLGIIVAYIGALESNSPLLDDDGSTWLLCDGAAVSQDTYIDLYRLIGDTFGVGPQDQFMLPNLAGYFVRTLDEDENGETSGYDPNYQNERQPTTHPPISYIGSVQFDAAPHEHAINYYAASDASGYTRNMMSNDDLQNINGQTDVQGSGETNPLNAAVNFIIRAKADDQKAPLTTSGLPVGSIVYYSVKGAPVPPQRSNETWIACDGIIKTGNRFKPTDDPVKHADKTQLFAAIDRNFGEGDGLNTIGIPDLRGFFLRGVTGATLNDPDSSSRKALNQNVESNHVGSTQLPAITDHTHAFWNSYGADVSEVGDFAVKLCSPDPRYTGTYQTSFYTNDTTRTKGTVGSDIRPINVALTTAILESNSTGHLPIGSIVAYGGSADPKFSPSGERWLICDGRPISDPSTAYQELFGALLFASTVTLCLPDLRGFFLRGFDNLVKTPHVELGWREPMFQPQNPGAYPTLLSVEKSTYGHHHHFTTSGHYINHTSNVECASADADGGPPDCTTDGVLSVASSETRPRNIYVNFIIRVA
jgi:microcystin-dependent protein